MVRKLEAEVSRIICRCRGVYTLELVPLGRQVRFDPGQFLHLALDPYEPSAGWPESRCFSIQSAPGEAVIRLTYAVKGAFTARMEEELSVGMKVCLKLPYGDLFLQPHSRSHTIFIAGGTGITPFLSLFSDPSFTAYSNPRLFFGVRSEPLDFYQAEIDQAVELNPGFAVARYFGDRDGLIDMKDVWAFACEESSFILSGPPEMISYFKNDLLQRNVDARRILTDDWE